jgi:hypothetical protein
MAAPAQEIPQFTVDLSLPPEIRYNHIVPFFKPVLEDDELSALFSSLVKDLAGAASPLVESIAPLILRRVYGHEETAEIQGLARATGISPHILIAFNVLLDLLLGCTSGGVRVFDAKSPASAQTTRILHFRTLDWGMDPLRRLTVQINYARHRNGPVVATSITYLGYVGILTGVRKGLSMSLNFRPHHARDSWAKEASFRWHQAMVVLGFRQSISSVLRDLLLSSTNAADQEEVQHFGNSISEATVQSFLTSLQLSRSTAAYLIFCTAEQVFVVEKDNGSAFIRKSSLFLAAANHDASDEAGSQQQMEDAENEEKVGMGDIVRFSCERHKHLTQMWHKRKQMCHKRTRRPDGVISVHDVVKLLTDEDISNEETHYAVVMDPKVGQILWGAAYPAET